MGTERIYFALDTLTFSFLAFYASLIFPASLGHVSGQQQQKKENREKLESFVEIFLEGRGGGLLVLWHLLVDSV